MDYARERYEASLDDSDFDEPEIDPGDVDDGEEASNDARPIYRCVDKSCGATDCSRCNPGGWWLDEGE